MPERETIKRAQKDKREGKSTSTQAGEFVREEIHHVREGKHGARSTKQAIAIGLSKARRAGVKLPAPKKGDASARIASFCILHPAPGLSPAFLPEVCTAVDVIDPDDNDHAIPLGIDHARVNDLPVVRRPVEDPAAGWRNALDPSAIL